MAINLPVSPYLSANRDRYPCHGNEWECAVCGRPVDMTKKPFMVRLLVGGYVVTTETEEEIDPSLDLGGHPIGDSCLRRHPELKPWAKR